MKRVLSALFCCFFAIFAMSVPISSMAESCTVCGINSFDNKEWSVSCDPGGNLVGTPICVDNDAEPYGDEGGYCWCQFNADGMGDVTSSDKDYFGSFKFGDKEECNEMCSETCANAIVDDAEPFINWANNTICQASTKTVTLNPNGAESGNIKTSDGTSTTYSQNATITCTPGDTVALPTWNSALGNNQTNLALTKKVFLGWATSSSASTGTTSITCPSSDTIYYAVWVTPSCNPSTGATATGLNKVSSNKPVCNRKNKAGYYCTTTYTGTAGATSVSVTCSACPTNWTSDAGSATAQTKCYRGVTLNKNGMSGILTLPSSHGCQGISSDSGTTSQTVYVYYNTACKLPSTTSLLSGTDTGTTYSFTGKWTASEPNMTSDGVTSITISTTGTPNTRYAGKKYTCAAGYYLKASTNGACTACTAGSYCPGVSNVYYSTSAQGFGAACPVGSYSSSGASTCTVCPNGSTTSGTGTAFNTNAATTCSVTCSNSEGVATWTTPTWNSSNNTVSNICTPATYNTYTISYAGMDGATHGTSHPTSGTYNSDVNIDNPTKSGYTFAGWNVSGMDTVTHSYGNTTSYGNTSTATSLSAITATHFKNLRSTSGTVTFTATWTQDSISCDTGYHSGTNPLSSLISGNATSGSYGTHANPWSVTYSGITVYGETKCSSTSGTQYAIGTPSDTTGNNCWCRVTSYTLTGGSTQTMQSQWVYKDSMSTCSSTSSENCADRCSEYAFGDGSSSTFFTGLACLPNTFNISYNKGSATGVTISGNNPSSPTSCQYDGTCVAPSSSYTVSPAGYNFSNWSCSASSGTCASSTYATNDSLSNATSVNGATITLTANWSPIQHQVPIYRNYNSTDNTYLGNTLGSSCTSGSNGCTSSWHCDAAKYGSAMPTLTGATPSGCGYSVPTRDGYTFTGLWDARSGGTKYYNADLTSARTWDKTTTSPLYAQWSTSTCTITFKTGNTTDTQSSFSNGNSLTTLANLSHVSSGAPASANGWTFAGWSKSYNTTTVDYQNGAAPNDLCTTNGASVTLYAIWKRNVNFKYYDSSTVTTPTTNNVGNQYYRNTNASTAGTTNVATPELYNNDNYNWTPVGWVLSINTLGDNPDVRQEDGASTNANPGVTAGVATTGVTYYALYNRTPTQLSFDANGGDGSVETVSCGEQYHNTGGNSNGYTSQPNCTLPAGTGFTKANATFAGWGTTSDATTVYSAGNEIPFPNNSWTSSNSQTMYAIWSCNAGYFLGSGGECEEIACTGCSDKSWTYDSSSHSCAVSGITPSGSTVKYTTTSGGTYTTTVPTVGPNVETKTVYYQITTPAANGNYTKTGSFSCKVTKASCGVTLSKTSETVTYPTASTTFTATTASGCTLSVSSGTTSVATASINTSTGKVTVTAVSAGTSTITVTATADSNHTTSTATYTANIHNKVISVDSNGSNDICAGGSVTCSYGGTCTAPTWGTSVSGILPSGYTQLEYIKTSGASNGSCISTGFQPSTTSYTHIIQFGIDSSVGSSERYISGTYYNTGRSGNVALVNSQINAIYINKTSGASGTYLNIINGTKPAISTGTKHTLELNLNNGAVSYAYLDGTKISSTSSTYNTGYISSTTNLKLGTYGSASSAAPTRIYGDTIIQNGVVIHNLIPAKNSSGTVGMYDTVTGVFQTNAMCGGSGSITAGTTVTTNTCNIANGSKVLTKWNTAADGSGTDIAFGGSLENVTGRIYAKWVTPTCSVTNGTGTPTTSVNNKPTCDVTCNSGYKTSGTYSGTANQTSYSYSCTSDAYTITVTAGRGVSKVAATGWTNTGTATMTKTANYNTTIDLSTVTPTYTTGYTGKTYSLSGTGTLSGNTFTVGDGAGTITLRANACSAGYYHTTTNTITCTACSTVANTSDTESGTDTTSTSTCPSGTTKSNATGTSQSYTKTCNGYYTGGAGGTNGADTCTGCSSYGDKVYGTCYVTSCATGYHTNATSNATSCVANTYSVKYNANATGATGSMSNSSHTYNVAKNLTANAFTNGNKKFLGWATSTSGDVVYTNGQSVTNLTTTNGGTVNLYAKWDDCTACATTNASCTLTAPNGVCTYATSCETGYSNIQNNGAYNASCSTNSYTITYNLNGGDELSSDCERLEYIQTDGNSFIDTGFQPTSTSYTHKLIFSPVSNVSSKYVCGTIYTKGRSGNVRVTSGKIDGIYVNRSSATSILSGTPTVTNGTKYTIELYLNNNAISTVYLNGTKISNTSKGTIDSDVTLKLGSYGSSGAPIKIYGDTIIQNGSIIHNFIPAKCDGVLGMYDTKATSNQFKSNAGTGSFTAPSTTNMPISYTYAVGATISAIPTRDHSVFAGWCTDSALTSCSTTQTISTTATGNKTFYAKWTCEDGYTANGNSCVPNTINITWANGGRGTTPTSPTECTYGQIFTMPTAMSATGYTFNGYTVNSRTFAGGASVVCSKDNLGVSSGNVTITGSWTAKTYTVTYAAGTGGSGSITAGTATYNANFTPATPSSSTITKANANFKGWAVSGTSDTKAAGTAFKWTYTAAKTFTATWSCKAGYGFNSTTNACEACEPGYYKASEGNDACSACSALSGVSPSGGTYTTDSTASTSNTACKYTAPSKTITGCKTVTSQAVTYSGSAWPASTYGVTASKGYVIANNNTSTATCTQCTSGGYQATDGSTATSCSLCSGLTAPSVTGGTFSSVSPYDANTTCRYTAPNMSSTPSNCSGVTTNTVSYDGSAWGTGFYTVTSAKGYKITSNNNASPTCAMCGAGTYTNGTNKTSCSYVSAGYYNTGAGTDANGSVASGSGKTGGAVSAGYYNTGAGTNATGSVVSGSGKTGGAVNAGYYSTGGGTSATPTTAGTGCLSTKECGPVTAGYYNTGCGTNATGGVCSTSSYSGGEISSGYYCTAGAKKAAPTSASDSVSSSASCGLCPTGYSGSDTVRNAITKCYKSCDATTVSNATPTSVSPDAAKVYYNTTSSAYPSCTYTPTCDTGYTATNGATPACTANTLTINLDKNDGTGTCGGATGTTAGSMTCSYNGTCTAPNWGNNDSAEYVDLEYLQSSGAGGASGSGQCINTGYVVGDTESIEVDYDINGAPATEQMLIAAYKSGESAHLWVDNYQNSKWYIRFGSTGSRNASIQTSQKSSTLTLKKNTFIVNNATIFSDINYTSMSTGSLTVFCRLNGSTVQYPATAKISGVRIRSSGDQLMRNYVPKKKVSTGELGLYDTVTGDFRTNIGTGNFTGPEIASGDGACTITNTNKILTGWNTNADGTGTSYALGADIQNIISSGSTTLYAMWTSCACGTDSNATCAVSGTSNNVCQYTHTCTNGYYNSNNGVAITSNTMTCTACGAGNKCPAGAKSPTACSGTNEWQDVTTATTCKTVTDGKYKKSNSALQNCGTGYYCKSGARTACKAADSGWTMTTDTTTGSTYSVCYEYQTPANCGSGTVKRAASSASAYSSTITLVSQLSANAGYYASSTATSCDACPTNWTSDAGATANTQCYRDVILNKNGASSGTLSLTLPSNSGCKSLGTGTGTNTQTLTVYYNTQCTFPVTTGMTLSNTILTGGWDTSASNTSTERDITVTATDSDVTYYAGKSACSCTNCTISVSNNTCGGTCSTGYSTSGGTNTGTSASCSGTSCNCSPRVFSVTLNKNTNSSDTTVVTTIYEKYATGVYTNSTATTAVTTSSNNVTQPTRDKSNNTTYTFDGYWTARTGGTQMITANGSLTINFTNTYYTADTTLYAQWKMKCDAGYMIAASALQCSACTAGYYCAGGTNYAYKSSIQGRSSCPSGYGQNPTTGQDAQSDCQISCSAGTRVVSANAACSTPDGSWYTAAHRVNYGSTSGSNVKSCTTDYATPNTTTASDHDEQKDCTKDITLDKNGGSGTITSPQTCQEGVACSLPSATVLTQDGYTFAAGWSTSDGTGATGCVTSVTTPTDDTYYACKTANGITLNWNENGGGAISNGSCTYDGDLVLPSAPTRSGYTFVGWKTADNVIRDPGTITGGCTSTYTGVTTGTSTSITAQWCQNCSAGTGANCSLATSKTGTMCTYTTSCIAGYGTLSNSGKYNPSCTQCSAGTYSADKNNTCSVCANNKWSDAGASSCTACTTANGYGNTGTTATSHAGKSSCKVTCAAGKQVSSAGGACSTPSGSWYTSQHTVDEGTTSGTNVQSCLTNYSTPNTTTQTDHDEATDCTITCTAGSRITTANNTSCTAITSGNVYMLEHTVAQGSASPAATDCPSGYTITGTAQTDHNEKADCKITCEAGYAVLTADETCTTIQNATYTGKYITQNTVSAGNISTISTCPTNYQTANGTTAQSNCTASCSAGTRVASANAACSTPDGSWYTLAHTVKYGSTSGSNVKSCTTNYATLNTTTASDHNEQKDCRRTITLNKNGGSGTIQGTAGTTNATVTCYEGQTCDFVGSTTSLTQTGYIFSGGWGTSTSCTSGSRRYTTPTSATYYACKVKQTYKVTFDKNAFNATAGSASTTVVYGNAMPTVFPNLADTAINSTRGSNRTSGGAYPYSENGTAYTNVFFKARSDTNYTYTTTTAGNRQSIFGYNSVVHPDAYTTSSKLSADTTIKEGAASGLASDSFETGTSTNMVMLYLSTTSGKPKGLQIYPTNEVAGQSITFPTRNGYEFDGYYDEPSGGTKYYNADGTSARTWNKTSDTTLYAHWAPNTIGTEWYNEDGNTQITVPTDAQTCTYDSGVNLPDDPTKTGYTFTGWEAIQ